MSTRIRLRRADYTNWSNDNPTLDYGEVGLVFDTISSVNTFVGFKIGDGSTTFDNLLMHRVPTSSGAEADGLTATGTGTEGAGGSVTTWDEIAILARAAQTFTGTNTFSAAVALAGGVTCDTNKITVSAESTAVVVGSGSDGTVHIKNNSDADVLTIGTDAASGLTVHGNDGEVTTAGPITATGAISTASTLTSTNTAAGSGAGDGTGITVNTDKFRVNASTGNTDIAGWLDVDGDTAVGGALAVGGAPALAKVWAPTDYAASYNSGTPQAGTEVEIGKWVGGQTLYQRTIEITTDVAHSGTAVTVSGMTLLTDVITHITILEDGAADTGITLTCVGPPMGARVWSDDGDNHLGTARFYQDGTAVKVQVGNYVDTNYQANGRLNIGSIFTVRYIK